MDQSFPLTENNNRKALNVSQKRTIDQNYKGRFWLHLAEIFKIL